MFIEYSNYKQKLTLKSALGKILLTAETNIKYVSDED